MDEWREPPRGRQIWWMFVLRGLLAAALGVVALIWPTLTMAVLVLLVGAYLIADGVMGMVVAARRSLPGGRWVQPVVSVVVGLVLIFWPGESARTLFVVLGAAALFMGISYLFTSRQLPAGTMDRQLMTTAGVVAAAIGVVLIVWPGAAVVTISWIVAVVALALAAVLIFLGLRFRQMGVEVIAPRDPAD